MFSVRLVEKFDRIDELIRLGQIDLAKNEFLKINIKSFDSKVLASAAKLARRLGLTDEALRLLHKRVRTTLDASPEELSEYAVSLIRAGYYREGDELLNRKELAKMPQTKYFQAFSAIYKWNYEDSLLLLRQYLAEAELSSYERLVAEVNSAASLIYLGFPKTETEYYLNELLAEARKQNAVRLEANLMELAAQNYLYHDDESSAEKLLHAATGRLSSDSSFDAFFIKKWKILMKVKSNPNRLEFIREAIEFRRQAQQNEHWEVARDIDFHLGIWNRNRSILMHQYFGTPHLGYRKRLVRFGTPEYSEQDYYDWRLLSKKRPDKIIDLKTGEYFQTQLKGQDLKVLQALACDFYRPARVSRIFESVFAGEYYDPLSSPNRTHKAVHRLKNEIRKLDWPINIQNIDGYCLSAVEGLGIRSYLNYHIEDSFYSKLKEVFGDNVFTSEQVATLFAMPKRSTQKKLGDLSYDLKLEKIGRGPSTKYKIKR